MPELPTSPHFRLEELAAGVYAAIHTPGGGLTGNAGIIDLGDRTLLFDTGKTAQAADDLRRAATELFHRPVAYVVNSHWHDDHVLGNQVFADATIISTPATRELMASALAQDVAETNASIAEYIQRQAAQLTQLTDPAQRAQLAQRMAENRLYADSIPTQRIVLPHLTCGDYLAFQGSARTAELRAFSGHTASDLILTLPEDRIAFLADLHFARIHPYLPDGDPAAWRDSLAQIATTDIALAVPGHGDVSDLGATALVRKYLAACQGIIADARTQGSSLADVLATPIPPPFDTWDVPVFFPVNLRFLYERERPHPNPSPSFASATDGEGL